MARKKQTPEMEISNFKITATFHFSNKYNNNKNIATVVLNINYIQKTFEIVPLSGSAEKFCFKSSTIAIGNETILKWKAIANGIEQASDFVVKELELPTSKLANNNFDKRFEKAQPKNKETIPGTRAGSQNSTKISN